MIGGEKRVDLLRNNFAELCLGPKPSPEFQTQENDSVVWGRKAK